MSEKPHLYPKDKPYGENFVSTLNQRSNSRLPNTKIGVSSGSGRKGRNDSRS